MSPEDLESILIAAMNCLDAAKLISAIRPTVNKHVSEYEEFLDLSLSQQLELLSALMSEYMSFCETEEYIAEEVGKEPQSAGFSFKARR